MTIHEAPRIETERLLLRPWRQEDFEPYYAIQCEPEVYRHFGPAPMGREDCWRRMCAATGLWALVGYGWWAVEARDSGQLIGTVGLLYPRRDMDPNYFDGPEMGWLMSEKVHGQGMAGEACRAVIDWARRSLAPSDIWAMIVPDNLPSIRLAQRLGFEEKGQSDHMGTTVNVYRRPMGR
jgi:RimJ/RimL family protein N-acetyltransferase